jgi:putative ABC transport system permease protein
MISTMLTVIGGISLLVGGIGVMNVMLISVTERTREIGIRKALGAPNSAIQIQFIVESMIMCLAGGIIGMAIGFAAVYITFALFLNTSFTIHPEVVLIAIGFSMAIGVFFGVYPANRAARLNPIEALRYE